MDRDYWLDRAESYSKFRDDVLFQSHITWWSSAVSKQYSGHIWEIWPLCGA